MFQSDTYTRNAYFYGPVQGTGHRNHLISVELNIDETSGVEVWLGTKRLDTSRTEELAGEY